MSSSKEERRLFLLTFSILFLAFYASSDGIHSLTGFQVASSEIPIHSAYVAPEQEQEDNYAPTDMAKWEVYILTLRGPYHHQMDVNPNPFTNYEFYATFTSPSGTTHSKRGYFDGNGEGGPAGEVWRVKFLVDEEGTWSYDVSFLLDGNPLHDDGHGQTDTFTVGPRNEDAPGFWKWGRLEYVNERYLKFRDGPYHITVGAGSPENYLGAKAIPGTSHHGKGVFHEYAAHEGDWEDGDPLWNNPETGVDSKGIIGALNYLSSVGINSIYFLVMNIGGDGKDTWPYAVIQNPHGSTNNDVEHFDLAKLHAWGKIFTHAQNKGIGLHMFSCEDESENKEQLGAIDFDEKRRILYEEMTARFGHYPAVQWIHCEEYDGTNGQIDLGDTGAQLAFVDGMHDISPTTLNGLHNVAGVLPLWINDGNFDNQHLHIASIQDPGGTLNKGEELEDFIAYAESQGNHPIVASFDEPRSSSQSNHHAQRQDVLWTTFLSEGAGVHLYVGGEDQSLEDFRKYEQHWNNLHYVYQFMQDIPFWEMNAADELVNGANEAQVLANPGQTYAVYLPHGENQITLTVLAGTYEYQWYDPVQGVYDEDVYSATSNGNPATITLANNPFTEAAVVVRLAEHCNPGDTRDCPLQDGVCAGSTQQCEDDGTWTNCDYGRDYEQEESSCEDRKDNDCDGATDGNDPNCNVDWIRVKHDKAVLRGNMVLDEGYTSDRSDPPDDDPDDDAFSNEILYASSNEDNLGCSISEADKAAYRFTVDHAGDYYLWGRFYYPGEPNSNDANSFCVQIDKGSIQRFGNNKGHFQEFHWDGDGNIETGPLVALPLGTLQEGTHGITVYKREVAQGIPPRLDYMVVSNREDFNPN